MANKLTKAQYEALVALEANQRNAGRDVFRPSVSYPGYFVLLPKRGVIEGTMKALMARGLIEGVSIHYVRITDAGRAAIAAEQEASAPDVPALDAVVVKQPTIEESYEYLTTVYEKAVADRAELRAELAGQAKEIEIRGELLNRVVETAQKHGFEHNGWFDSVDYVASRLAAQDAELAAARDEIARLRAALAPFAAMWRELKGRRDVGQDVYGFNDTIITRDDLRRADDALKADK